MSSEQLAPWAVRAALAGLSNDQARELLESERYPEPDVETDRWEARTKAVSLAESGEVIIYNTENESAWVQSTTHVTVEEMQ